MATKKITELQLISAITGTENLPADNGLQTYRCTPAQLKSYILANQNILLAMLKDDIFNGLTSVTAADDDYFTLIDSSDSNKTKKALVGSFVRTKYRAVSSYPATVTSSDGTLKLSGSSGTITLPATGNPGARYKFIHTGTSLTQVYTLATTGGATIGGVASGSYKLCTNGEVLEVEDDGTDWLIVHHRAQTGWVDGGTWTLTASSSNPTKGTVAQDKVWWRRDGDRAFFRYEYRQTAGGSAGSGDYYLALPSGMTFRSDVLLSTAAFSDSGWDPQSAAASRGLVRVRETGDGDGDGFVVPYDTGKFRLFLYNHYSSSSGWDNDYYDFAVTAIGMRIEFDAPIADWRP